MSGFVWSSANASERGHVRAVNEDECLDEPGLGLWAVADGMGGHERGDLASHTVVTALKAIEARGDLAGLAREVEQRIGDANNTLQAMAEDIDGPIGSTVAVLVAVRGDAACLWVGDSRVYRLRQGCLQCLSRDHSEVELLMASGELTAAEALDHPDRNVLTRAVGASVQISIETAFFSLKDKDRFLLSTDGLHRDLPQETLHTCLSKGNAAQVCDALMASALQGPCVDNASAVVVDFERHT